MGVSKISGIAIASIAKVSGTTATQYAKVHGSTTAASPPAGASRVVACFDDAYVSWADLGEDTDVTVWEDNMFKAGAGGDSWDILDIAFGKNGSGDPFYVAVANSNNPEILYDDDGDITDGESWLEINLGSGSICRQSETENCFVG